MTVLRSFEASYAMTRAGDARVTVVGELDFDTAPQVRAAVARCMANRPGSLRLDLTGVGFCDCAGFNVLLEVRTSVLLAGADLVVEGIGPVLARLLSLLGADSVLTEGRTEAHVMLAGSE